MFVKVKLIAMAVLLVIALFFAFAIGYSWQWLVCAAVLFSWLGDMLLARFEPLASKVHDPFIAGMGSFAVAHIMYCIAFSRSMSGMPALHVRTPGMYYGIELIGMLLPVYLLIGLFFWVWIVFRSKQTWDIKIATLLYCLLLSGMAACAAAAACTGVSFVWPLMTGGILFMISDGFIAAHIFADKLLRPKQYEIAVWGTYLPAQILLVLGASRLY